MGNILMTNEVYVTLQNSINNDGLWYPSISIYFSGCDKSIKCPNCHNPELQQKGIGYKTTNKNLIDDIEIILNRWLDIYPKMSLCYLGGEPLSDWNRESVYLIAKYFKLKYKDKICNIIYTWRYLENIKHMKKYITYIDYGVLGSFHEENKNTNYIPSSTNQYIYDFVNNKKIQSIKKG